MAKRPAPPPENVAIILLAAGYGTRLHRDLTKSRQFMHLLNTPKPLLPIAGKTILDHWLDQLSGLVSVSKIVVVTNAVHESLYKDWLKTVKDSSENIEILSDGSKNNESRLGAVADIELALGSISKTHADKTLIIAGDTLLPDSDVSEFVQRFGEEDYPLATFAYPLSDMSDCSRRGMYKVIMKENLMLAEQLVEKPKAIEESPSKYASAPLYLIRRSHWSKVTEFLSEKKDSDLNTKDAPGHWISWMLQKEPCRLYKVSNRIDIGGLLHFKSALWKLCHSKGKRHLLEPAVGRAFPRVGLLGNPSDGYGGKVIGVSIASEGYAEVVATPSDTFQVDVNEKHELDCSFASVDNFLSAVVGKGIDFGARRLVVAACVLFFQMYQRSGVELGQAPSCRLSYSTSIPLRKGLSGSSALILATLRALARFYETTLHDVHEDQRVWAEEMQKVESEVLGISCGLQDRVVQLKQGCVYMDFSSKDGEWKNLCISSFPQLYLIYCPESLGDCSGKVHGKLRERHKAGDEVIKNAVTGLCEVVEEGKILLESNNIEDLPRLFSKNFELRCSLVGKESVGHDNLQLVSVAKKAGFTAKMSGSGGCAVCIPNTYRELSDEDLVSAKRMVEDSGLVLRKLKLLEALEWK